MPSLSVKFEDFKVSGLVGCLVQLDGATNAPIFMVGKQGTNYVGTNVGFADGSTPSYNVVNIDGNLSPKVVFGKLIISVNT